jgi:hypothetical protein
MVFDESEADAAEAVACEAAGRDPPPPRRQPLGAAGGGGRYYRGGGGCVGVIALPCLVHGSFDFALFFTSGAGGAWWALGLALACGVNLAAFAFVVAPRARALCDAWPAASVQAEVRAALVWWLCGGGVGWRGGGGRVASFGLDRTHCLFASRDRAKDGGSRAASGTASALTAPTH